jgi:hypothetical protein
MANMLFFWGVVSILQVCYLPGALLLLAVLGPRKWYETIPLAFGLSLIVNYIAVLVLVMAGIYVRSVMIGLVATELIAYFYMLSRSGAPALEPGRHSHQKYFSATRLLEWSGRLLFLVVLALAWIYVWRFKGDIFQAWDAVVSWNRWAVDWASNRLPNTMWHYPQLLPAVWSVSYVLMADAQIQFFPVLVCLLFVPMAAHAFFMLYNKSDQVSAKISILIAGLIFLAASEKMSGLLVGFADFPVAVMILLAFSCLFMAGGPGISKKEATMYAALGLLLAGGGGLTKQGGVFGYLAYIATMIGLYRDKCLPGTLLSRKGIIFLIGTMLLVFSWYAFIQWRIAISAEGSEIKVVTETIHQGRNYLERIALSMRMFPYPWAVAALASPGLFFHRIRMITACGLIYVLIWGCFFSYDQRNCSPALPLLAFAVGGWFSHFIMCKGISKIGEFYACMRRKNLWPAFLTCLFLGAVLSLQVIKFPDTILHARQHEKLMNLGDPAINKAVLDSFATYGPGIILTGHQYLLYIPDVGSKYFQFFTFGAGAFAVTPEQITNYNQKRETALSDQNIKYVLLPSQELEAVQSILVKQGITARQIEFAVPGYSYLMLR